MEEQRNRVTFNEPKEPLYEPPSQESSAAKWFVPLVAAIALVVAALFIFDVIDADVDVNDPGSINVDAPDVDVDVDVDVPGVDVEDPDAEAEAGDDGE